MDYTPKAQQWSSDLWAPHPTLEKENLLVVIFAAAKPANHISEIEAPRTTPFSWANFTSRACISAITSAPGVCPIFPSVLASGTFSIFHSDPAETAIDQIGSYLALQNLIAPVAHMFEQQHP